jgi:hypothetical protein
MICLSAEDNAENHQDVLFLIGRTGVAERRRGKGTRTSLGLLFLGRLGLLGLGGLVLDQAQRAQHVRLGSELGATRRVVGLRAARGSAPVSAPKRSRQWEEAYCRMT